jgi:hypothetical protein
MSVNQQQQASRCESKVKLEGLVQVQQKPAQVKFEYDWVLEAFSMLQRYTNMLSRLPKITGVANAHSLALEGDLLRKLCAVYATHSNHTRYQESKSQVKLEPQRRQKPAKLTGTKRKTTEKPQGELVEWHVPVPSGKRIKYRSVYTRPVQVNFVQRWSRELIDLLYLHNNRLFHLGIIPGGTNSGTLALESLLIQEVHDLHVKHKLEDSSQGVMI